MSLLAPTYAPPAVSFVRGQGAWLYDDADEAYLDFASGIAVSSLGHGHPTLVSAIQEQSKMLLHTSNLYGIEGQNRVAERLVDSSFAQNVFFCNSGAEAMEACIKFARRYHWHHGNPEKVEILTFQGAFHGRTLSTIAAGGSEKYTQGFGPLSPGFRQVAFSNLNEARAAISEVTAALLIEPVQGEGGIRPHSPEILAGLRQMADEFGLLLIFDEIQTGVGRTGKMWAYEHAGIEPDLMASAKGLGGGFPVGAALMTSDVAACLQPGIHGTTYGGNPLAMAASEAVLSTLIKEDLIENASARGDELAAGLTGLCSQFPALLDLQRGLGLLRGLRLQDHVSPGEFVSACLDQNLLVVPAGDQTVRMLPPLTVSSEEVGLALGKLARVCRSLQ